MNKPQLNFIGDFFSSLLSSNSVNFDDIALSLLSIYPDNQLESLCRRISNFLNNYYYSYHNLFDRLIIHILPNYNVKHDNNRVFISFNYIFVKDKFTTFLLSIKDSLSNIHNLLKSIVPLINIVWLSNRWFGNLFSLFNFIYQKLKDSFIFRCKDNFKVLFYFEKEKRKIWCSIHDLPQSL